jgi:ankyrin repeat protein
MKCELKCLLIKGNANPNVWTDNDGNLPIHIACQLGLVDVVDALISTGKARPSMKNQVLCQIHRLIYFISM